MFAAEYTMEKVLALRLDEGGDEGGLLHVRYRYQHIVMPGKNGIDQRTFRIEGTGGAERIVSMGGHKSARFPDDPPDEDPIDDPIEGPELF